ncbi:MAG: CDP-glycerol glycerophosphotransferase family protein, partial [Bacteroidetes bacterium]|nr:CDP-glycerol glycerophosphotransferase family protein [Bacteroidota bacterium]
MNKLKKLLIYILNIPLYWISCCIPKNKNVWIFGAWFGEKYADNSKYLFEYVNRDHSHVRAVWLSKNKKTVESIRSKGYEVYYTYDIRSILLALKARFSIFVQSNMSDNLMFLNNKNTKLIQLWHGSPLK